MESAFLPKSKNTFPLIVCIIRLCRKVILLLLYSFVNYLQENTTQNNT